MRTARTLGSILLGATLLTTSLAPGVVAQDPSYDPPSVMCSLFSAQEVSDAVGVPVGITTSTDEDCSYEADPTSATVLLVSSRRSADALEDLKTAFPGEDIDVSGQPARFVPGDFSPLLFVGTPDGGTYTLQVVGSLGEGVDAKVAMSGLAALALSRLGSLGAMPTQAPPEPQQTFHADAGLEALFPSSVGGIPVTIQSMSGADLTGEDTPPAFQAALAAAGKTMADVRIAIGYVLDPAGTSASGISAFQVKGADIAALKAAMLPILFEGQEIGPEAPLQLGGKDITMATIDDVDTYLYPRDDILWLVTAEEPALTEIFQQLP